MKGEFYLVPFIDKKEKVRNNLEADTVINKSAKPRQIKPKSVAKQYVCQTCGEVYTKRRGNFSPSKSPLYAGNESYLSTCKHCVDKLFEQYSEMFSGNEEKAIERICQIFDLYFNEDVLASSKKVNSSYSRITAYISKVQLNPHAGKTYSDTIIERQENSTINTVEDIAESEEMSPKALKKAVSLWGLGFSAEQYTILNDQFDDWKSRVVIDGKTREMLVRELCIIKLQSNLALQDNNVELYTKLIKTYQDTMKSANLQPLQQDENDKASEKPIGVMIQMFENERPISEPREEWKDVDHIVKYITIYFLGHLCKMLKIKNRYSSMYEEEMAKYRVEIPELEEADDEDIFSFLVENGVADGTETEA